MARTYTDTQKTDAVNLYVEHGLAEAHHRTGIPKPSLRNWARAAGHDTATLGSRAASKTAAATEAKTITLEARRVVLAENLMGDVERLRMQLFAPCVEKKALVVSGGMHAPGEVAVIEIVVDSKGAVYAADTYGQRIQKFVPATGSAR